MEISITHQLRSETDGTNGCFTHTAVFLCWVLTFIYQDTQRHRTLQPIWDHCLAYKFVIKPNGWSSENITATDTVISTSEHWVRGGGGGRERRLGVLEALLGIKGGRGDLSPIDPHALLRRIPAWISHDSNCCLPSELSATISSFETQLSTLLFPVRSGQIRHLLLLQKGDGTVDISPWAGP